MHSLPFACCFNALFSRNSVLSQVWGKSTLLIGPSIQKCPKEAFSFACEGGWKAMSGSTQGSTHVCGITSLSHTLTHTVRPGVTSTPMWGHWALHLDPTSRALVRVSRRDHNVSKAAPAAKWHHAIWAGPLSPPVHTCIFMCANHASVDPSPNVTLPADSLDSSFTSSEVYLGHHGTDLQCIVGD